MPSHTYKAKDGNEYPLIEARYDMPFMAYRSDRRIAIPSDPEKCVLALGIRRKPDVLGAYVGSGKDAYVIFAPTDNAPAQAVHFIVNTTARRVLDAFDHDKKASTQMIILRRPSKANTLEERRQSEKRRAAAIKNGTRVVKKRAVPQRKIRIARMGVLHRPRPQISKSGNVNAATASNV